MDQNATIPVCEINDIIIREFSEEDLIWREVKQRLHGLGDYMIEIATHSPFLRKRASLGPYQPYLLLPQTILDSPSNLSPNYTFPFFTFSFSANSNLYFQSSLHFHISFSFSFFPNNLLTLTLTQYKKVRESACTTQQQEGWRRRRRPTHTKDCSSVSSVVLFNARMLSYDVVLSFKIKQSLINSIHCVQHMKLFETIFHLWQLDFKKLSSLLVLGASNQNLHWNV